MRGRSPDNAALPEPGPREHREKTLLLDMTGKDPTGMLFPLRQALQFLRMQRVRRRLSEPRAAGQRSAAFVWSQRWTSEGDSSLLGTSYYYVTDHTYCQENRLLPTKINEK